MNRPCCEVAYRRGPYHVITYMVDIRHYEDLRSALDHNEKGWRELDSVFGNAKIFLRVDNIADLFLATQSYCNEADEIDAHERLENGS